MSDTNKFDPQDLDPNALNEALQSLSGYYIPKRRLRIHEQTLGVGGFGTVKLADLSPNTWSPFGNTLTTVAVKELRTENHGGVLLRSAVRLAREIKVWASCKHANILEFTGYYLSEDFREAYLVSPYMANGNIKRYLEREARSQEQRLKLVLGTIKGLAYLHASKPPIVHGDLKSLNVLVTNEGEALLCDLGLAKAIEDKPTGLSTSNGFKGTIRYTSPEALNGSPRDCPSDIWAWGCLLLEIMTGNPPYHECRNDTQVLILICGPQDHRRTPEPSDVSSLPSTTLELMRMCWSFEPGQRPDASQCFNKVDAMSMSPALLSSGLPEHLYVSSTRLGFSVRPKDWSNLLHGIILSRQDTDKAVMVKCLRVAHDTLLETVADELKQRWALKHENLLELTGYSMDQGLRRFYVISPYMPQPVLLEYMRQNRRLAARARLKLLQDMLNGLVYLHSSAVNVVHGALNPWTVVVNSEGKAVLPLIGSFHALEDVIVDGSPVRPTHLWLDPNRFTLFGISSKSDIWSWACIVLQVICENRQFDGTSIHGPEFMESIRRGENPEPSAVTLLPDRLLGLVRKCWNQNLRERPSASDCLGVLDLVIQEISFRSRDTGFLVVD